MQLEKRGTVIGDRTAGAVMRAKGYPHETGVDTVAFYMISVTDGDLIMSDGKSLEGTGVVPDELLLPAGGDLAMRRDLPLARALSLAGIQIPADKAAALFPVEWRK
jgi:C-terminal processing protease CtpA/Prc